MAVAVAAQIAGTVSGLIVAGAAIVIIDYAAPSSDLYMQTVLFIFGAVGIALSFFGGWRKRLEDERLTMLQEMKRVHERLAIKHEVARMGTFEWFVEEGYFRWSPEMEKIYGRETPDHVHTREQWKAYLHPDDVDEALAALEEAPQQRQLPACDHTFRITRPDGKVRWIHSRRHYEYDANGKPVHVMGINIDITELKQGEVAQQILGGLLHVCSVCRRIQDDTQNNEWCSMDRFLHRHHTKLSHGMCPECLERCRSQEEGET